MNFISLTTATGPTVTRRVLDVNPRHIILVMDPEPADHTRALCRVLIEGYGEVPVEEIPEDILAAIKDVE